MVIASFGLLLIVPSVIVGLLLAHRRSPVGTFLAMLSVFGMTASVIWLSLSPLLTSTEGIAILVAEILVALVVAGINLPIVTRLHSALYRPNS